MKQSSILLITTLLVSAAAVANLACGTGQARKQPSERHEAASLWGLSENSLQIIDAHTHTRFDGRAEKSSGLPVTLQEFLKEMRESGVVGAIAHSGADDQGYQDLRENGIIHCAGMDAKVNERKLEADLKSGKYRCIKIYLGYVHQYAYDPNYEPAYRMAEKYDVPVVFHTGDTYSSQGKLKYSDPLTIDEVAVDHPKVRFVIAHIGNPWIESAAEVAYKNPNVFLEGSALLIGDFSKIDPQQIDEYVVRPLKWTFGYVDNPTKLMYGSDWPLVRMDQYIAAFKRAIPKEHWQAVFHDNAARVFKLKPKP